MKRSLFKSAWMAIFLGSAIITSNHTLVQAQLAVYGPVAESMQSSTHNLFLNSSGNYYNQTNGGNTGFNYWWNAHGVDVLADGYFRTRSSTYLTRMKNLLRGIKIRNGNTYDNNFYDDMEWLAISSLRAYEATKDIEYLNVANELWGYIKTGKRGTSFQWKKDCPDCRNTCANTPAIIFAVRRHRITGNAEDLQIAREVFAWVKSTLVDPATGAVWDAYNAGTGAVGKSRYSYNQGTYIGAALELYKMTGEMAYMDDAIKTANYAISNQIDGVLYPNAGGGDGGLFNGILVRYLALFAREGNISQANRDQYINVIKSSAQTLKNQGLNTSNMTCSPKWGVPPGTSTDYSSQLSGVMLLEAASTFDQVIVYQNITYGGTSSGFAPGSYTLSALNARGVLDNDVTSITIPGGYQVTVYENNNFSGASVVYSSNQTWLNTWNDRISSFKISDGTCNPPAIIPYVAINGGSWQQITSVNVNVGGTVTFGPQPLDGTWKWNGPNGYSNTSRAITLGNIQSSHAGVYRATYTLNGCSATLDFTLNVTTAFSQTIEAENYSSASGVIKETCSEGGQNLGSFDAVDWASYAVTIPASGTYKVTYRVSSIYTGKTLRLEKDNGATQLGTVTVPNTTNWQLWTSVSHTVTLPAGTYSIRLATATGGINVNRFNITNNLAASASTARMSSEQPTEASPEIVVQLEDDRPEVYPNPYKNKVKISVTVAEAAYTEVSILDSKGNCVADLHRGKLEQGVYTFEYEGSDLPAGQYLYASVQMNGKRRVEKFVRE